MKKSLILAGMLSIGFAYAQEYDGKVGINTESPSATLNVKSLTGTDDTTKNLELTNKSGNRLVTVLDNGNVGIGARTSTEEVALADVLTTDEETDTQRYNRLNIVFPGERKSILFQGNSTKVGNFNKHERMSSRMRYTWYDATADIGMIRGASAWIAGLAINFNDVEKVRFDYRGRIGVNTNAPTNTLHIVPESTSVEPLKIEGLQEGTGSTLVVDANGVVKKGSANSTTSTNLKANNTTETCSDTNLGAIHFKEVTITGSTNGEKKGVFGFCTKQNGTAMWVYLSNGGSIMQGTGAFGEGL